MSLTGQIGLIPHPHSVVSWAIEKVTKAKVHHVVIALDETRVIGAEPGGARVSKVSEWPCAIWSRFDYTTAQVEGVVNYAESCEGIPYSFLSDAAIGVASLLGRNVPNWLAEYIADTGHVQCAQLADNCLTYGAGIHLFADGRLPGAVFPGSYVPIWKANGWWP